MQILQQLTQAASNRVGDEILIFSDKLNFDESISKLKDAISGNPALFNLGLPIFHSKESFSPCTMCRPNAN